MAIQVHQSMDKGAGGAGIRNPSFGSSVVGAVAEHGEGWEPIGKRLANSCRTATSSTKATRKLQRIDVDVSGIGLSKLGTLHNLFAPDDAKPKVCHERVGSTPNQTSIYNGFEVPIAWNQLRNKNTPSFLTKTCGNFPKFAKAVTV